MATVGSAAPSSNTVNYDALLSTTLFNYHKTLEDNISKTNSVLFYIMKKGDGTYEGVDDIGDRMQVPLMYELGTADSYSGYDVLDVTPMDGITSSFWEWRQAAVPIAISGLEEKKNSGSAKILSLLKSKTTQAEMGIQEFFNRRLLTGAGGSTITTPYSSTINGSQFLDPLPLLIHFTPSSAATVGNIPQATYSWWRNQTATQGGTTYAAFLKELRALRVKCNRGPGGTPDLHFVSENVYTLYESALAAAHQNPSYQKADIPFDNIAFYGSPVTYDELMPDAANGSDTLTTTSESWYMINSKFFMMKYHKGTNFTPTPFQKPENQDAKVAHILWLGGIGLKNRRKHGVMGSIDTTISS